MDKAGRDYWNRLWSGNAHSPVHGSSDSWPTQFVRRKFSQLFSDLFSGAETRGKRLIEFGCAGSTWLPHFANTFGFDVSGIDYSEVGCDQARAVLQAANVRGEVIRADFLEPPGELEERFDVGVSFGVAEHFLDTAACISAFSRFIRHGGRLLTVVPNLAGSIGLVQRLVNRPVFEIHVVLDKPRLVAAHLGAGITIERADYFMSTNFGVCNLNGLPEGSLAWRVKRLTLTALTRMSFTAWHVEEWLGAFAAPSLLQRAFSPYIYCFGVKG